MRRCTMKKDEEFGDYGKDCCNQGNCCSDCGYEDCHESCGVFDILGSCENCDKMEEE